MKPDIYSHSPWPFRKLKLNKIDSIQNITINKQFFYQNKKRLLSFRYYDCNKVQKGNLFLKGHT